MAHLNQITPMTQPTLLINDVYAVEVPEGSKKHHLSFTGKTATSDDQSLYYKTKDADELDEWKKIDLPEGNWQLIGTTKGVTEDIAAQIVERDRCGFTGHIEGYKDYAPIGFDMQPFNKAVDSLQTLLQSKKLDPNKNYVLLINYNKM